MERTMSQKLGAEFIGTFTVVFVAAGSVIAAQGPAGGLVTIALAYGLSIAVMVSAAGHISGAHFNPAVTIAAWVTQKISNSEATAYIVAQLAGAAAGAAVLRAAFPETIWRANSLGVSGVTPAISNGQAVLIEAVLTFFLVWVIFATTIDPEGAFGKIAGLSIGFTIAAGVMMGGPFTGGAMNPARWFGPAAVGGFWSNWWVWLIGPIAGGIVAASVYDTLYLRARAAAAAEVGMEEPHAWGAHGEHEHPGDAPSDA